MLFSMSEFAPLPPDHPCYLIPIDLRIKEIQYSNDTEYKTVLQYLCHNRTDLETQLTLVLDFIWENTHDIPEFAELYQMGAEEMISEDATIGLAIMFSYDNLRDFYPFFRDYMCNTTPCDAVHPNFVALKTRLAK
jgi:hypothetical protein